MRKYILTENQIKNLIDSIILEINILEESEGVYNLSELAGMIARTGVDEETILEVLKDLYRNGGDEEIKKIFRKSVGVDIDEVGHGRYVVKF